MNYNVTVYALAYQGEVEADNEETLEQKLKNMLGFPQTAPLLIYHNQEIKETT